jgi:integrase
MTSKTLSRPDKRQWENDSKLGGRLRHQVGSTRYKSSIPDPERPGRDLVQHFHADNWTQARKLHAKRTVRGDEGAEPRSAKTTLDDLAQQRWTTMEGLIASGERAPGTLEAEKILYRKHLAPLGRVKVQQLTHARVSVLLAKLRQEGYKASTIARIYAVLRSLLNLAVRRGLLVESPLKRLDPSEVPSASGKRKGRSLADEENSRLIEHALPSTRTLVAFYAFTGVRQSEALAVRWGDLDLEAGVVTIGRQLVRKKRGQTARCDVLKTARRESGCKEREIELHPALVKLLKRHKADAFARGHAGSGDYVFATTTGGPLSQRNVTRDLRKAADRAGLTDDEKLTTHDLRHTAISRWIAAGLDPVTVARMAGDTVETILKTYAHEFERARRKDEIRAKLEAGTRIILAL